MSRPLDREEQTLWPSQHKEALCCLWAFIQVFVGRRRGAVERMTVLLASCTALRRWFNLFELGVVIVKCWWHYTHHSQLLWGLEIAYAKCLAQKSSANGGLIVVMGVTHFVLLQPVAGFSCLLKLVSYLPWSTDMGGKLWSLLLLDYSRALSWGMGDGRTGSVPSSH